MGNSYTSKKPCSVWLVKGVGETPSTDCITDILDGEGIYVSGTKTVKVISLLPPRDGHIGGVKRKETPNNAVEIDPKTGEIFVAKSGVDFPITIEQGGTGKTNREDALLALLPDTLDQEGKVLSVYKKDDGTTSVKWIDMPNVGDYIQGDGINISNIDPETGKRTISTKVNASEFRYNDNGLIELSDQVTNALAKASTSVQTVNNTPPDENGNVNVAGSLPVLTLISDFVGDISVLRNWLLIQPDQQSILHIKTQTLPDIQVVIFANGFTENWEELCSYIQNYVKTRVDGCPNFTCRYNTDGELELSTNDILNPIEYYIPVVPDNESLNVQMKLVSPGAVIVSQPYATIDQVNTIVNNAIIPLQQDIQLLNLDMFFADYYIGISINYLLSGKWAGDEASTYEEILTQLNDTNILKFTLSNDNNQYDYSLTITRQQFIDFETLDNFNIYISRQMLEQYEIQHFSISFKQLGTQGFLISNLDSDKGILVCEQDNNNLAVIMKLTDLTGAIDSIYTLFSNDSLQQQIIDNQLIIKDTVIKTIDQGDNINIEVDAETNKATFNATGGSGGVTPEEARVISTEVFDEKIISIQQQITNNRLIIDNVFINKINNGSNVNIAVNSETNTATISATGGGSGGANKVTVSVNGANPIAYNVDGTGNIAINVPLTTSLTSNLLSITNDTGINAGKTNLRAYTSSDFAISPASKELELSTATKADIAKGVKAETDLTANNTILKGNTAVQNIIVTGSGSESRTGNDVTIDIQSSSSESGYQTYEFTGQYRIKYLPNIIPTAQVLLIKKPFPSQQIVISCPKVVDYYDSTTLKTMLFATSLSSKSINTNLGTSTLTNGDGLVLQNVKDWLNQNSGNPAWRTLILTFDSGNVSFECTLADCPTFNDFANFIQTKVRSFSGAPIAFTCVYNGKNFVMSSNYPGNNIKYPNINPTVNPFSEVMRLTQSTNAQLFTGFTVGDTQLFDSQVLYDTTNPPTTVTINNEYFILKLDPRVIYTNPIHRQYNQALIVITADSYVKSSIIPQLPNYSTANFSPIGESANVTYWTKTNQIGNYSGFFYVPQLPMYYRNTDLNQTSSGDLIQYSPNFSLNQSSQTHWKTTLICIGNLDPAKAHYLRLNIATQTTNGVPCTYTIFGKTSYQMPDIPIPSMVNPVTVINVECDNNNISFNISWTNYTNNAVALTDSGTSGLDKGQINLGDGFEALWNATQLFHPVPLYSSNWKYNLLEKTYTINGGGVLTLYFSGTFALTEPFIDPNTKLYVTVVNISDYKDKYQVEIPFINQSIIEQALFDLSITVDLTERIEQNDYKIIITANPVDSNVYFKIVDFLGMVLVYE